MEPSKHSWQSVRLESCRDWRLGSPERAPVAYQMAPAPAIQWIVGTLLLLIDLGEECKDQFLGNEA